MHSVCWVSNIYFDHERPYSSHSDWHSRYDDAQFNECSIN